MGINCPIEFTRILKLKHGVIKGSEVEECNRCVVCNREPAAIERGAPVFPHQVHQNRILVDRHLYGSSTFVKKAFAAVQAAVVVPQRKHYCYWTDIGQTMRIVLARVNYGDA